MAIRRRGGDGGREVGWFVERTVEFGVEDVFHLGPGRARRQTMHYGDVVEEDLVVRRWQPLDDYRCRPVGSRLIADRPPLQKDVGLRYAPEDWNDPSRLG